MDKVTTNISLMSSLFCIHVRHVLNIPQGIEGDMLSFQNET